MPRSPDMLASVICNRGGSTLLFAMGFAIPATARADSADGSATAVGDRAHLLQEEPRSDPTESGILHEAHAMTLANRPLSTADNRDVMRGMNADPVDPIYLDPPLNSSADYSGPIGSEAGGSTSKDTSTLDESDAEWHGQARSASLLATWDR